MNNLSISPKLLNFKLTMNSVLKKLDVMIESELKNNNTDNAQIIRNCTNVIVNKIDEIEKEEQSTLNDIIKTTIEDKLYENNSLITDDLIEKIRYYIESEKAEVISDLTNIIVDELKDHGIINYENESKMVNIVYNIEEEIEDQISIILHDNGMGL